jgi:fructose-bisphosphate aldolase class I
MVSQTSQLLRDTVNSLLSGDKGLLAMDESTSTCNERFAKLSIPQTEETRRAYRELIVTTPGLEEAISGAILVDETIRQTTQDGIPFIHVLQQKGIVPGIKVDMGAKPLAAHPEEKITEGLDGLRERLHDYFAMGARFAKWRAVITIGASIPSRGCMEANAHALARYAALCQEEGIVPVVKPEVLMTGDHDLDRCRDVTEATLKSVFDQLSRQRVQLDAIILKPNMVLSGLKAAQKASIDEVAAATLGALANTLPPAVPGVAFLSGGQSAQEASAHLNAINRLARQPHARAPWALTFSFSRATQQPALEIWHGDAAHVVEAQKALYHRAMCNGAARRGEYSAALERA